MTHETAGDSVSGLKWTRRTVGHSREPAPFRHHFHLRSLPSAGITGLPRYPADLSATLPARPDPHGLSVGVCHATGQGFPCCVHSPLPHMPPPLPRRNRSVLASPASRPLAAFPASVMGRLPHHSFRGLLGVHFALWPAWSLSRPWWPFVIGVLQPMSLPPSSAPTATGWGDRCRAGFAPAEEQRLVTAHTERPLLDAGRAALGQPVRGLVPGGPGVERVDQAHGDILTRHPATGHEGVYGVYYLAAGRLLAEQRVDANDCSRGKTSVVGLGGVAAFGSVGVKPARRRTPPGCGPPG